jgi:hypothetical protein
MLHTGEWNVLIGASSFAKATEKNPVPRSDGNVCPIHNSVDYIYGTDF